MQAQTRKRRAILHWLCSYCNASGIIEHDEAVHPLGVFDQRHRHCAIGNAHLSASTGCHLYNGADRLNIIMVEYP